MVGFRTDTLIEIDESEDDLPDEMKLTSTGLTVDQCHDLLRLPTLKAAYRQNLKDFPAYLVRTREDAARAFLGALETKLAEAGLNNLLLSPASVFSTYASNIAESKTAGRTVGFRLVALKDDIAVSIERLQQAFDTNAETTLTLTLREEGETESLKTISLTQAQHYKWHDLVDTPNQLPTFKKGQPYLLTYNEDDLGTASMMRTLAGGVKRGCGGCGANCVGNYMSVQPIYLDTFGQAVPVSNTNWGLNLTISAYSDLSGRLVMSPGRMLKSWRHQIAVTFLEKIAYSNRNNPETEEAVQSALFALTDKDNADRIPAKLDKALDTLVKSLADEAAPSLKADEFDDIIFGSI